MSKNFKLLLLFLAPLSITAQEVEEVIVTANKKAETVMEIPMNISVITEATLDERGILNPEDYLRSIAGVSTPGGSNYYTFRGLNTSTSQRSSGTTSTYVDEINGSLMNLFDVERVEVLRGPQGTLYGSNAIGGTIRYITNKPDASGAYGKVRIGYGNKRLADNPETTIEGMYNMPLSDSVALRALRATESESGMLYIPSIVVSGLSANLLFPYPIRTLPYAPEASGLFVMYLIVPPIALEP